MTRRSPMAPLAGGLMLPFLAVLAFQMPAAAVQAPAPPPSVYVANNWGQWGTDDFGQYHVVGEVVNSDSLQRAANIQVTASGPGVLETVDADAAILAPGERSPFDVPVNAHCSPCAVSVTWGWTTDPANHKFTVSTDPPITHQDGTQFITGTVTNNNKIAADYINVLFTFKDGSGNVVDTDLLPLDNNATSSLDAGDSATFELVRSPAHPGNWTTVTAYAESGSPPSLPIVSPTPVPLDEGPVAVADTTSKTLTVNNTGNDDLDVTSLDISGDAAGDYTVDSSTCAGPVVAGNSCAIVVDFSPSAPGSRAATLSLTDEAADSPQAIALTGQGLAPAATVPSAVAFGDVVKGNAPTKNVTVTNSGTRDLHVDAASGITSGSSDFSSDASGCSAAPIAPQHSCTIVVTFAPAAAVGDESATLTVFDDAFGSPEQDVALTGTSTNPVLTVSPSSLSFTAAVSTSSAQQTVTVKNGPNGSGNLHVGTVSFGGAHPGDFSLSNDGCSGQTLAPSATCTVKVTFTPQGIGDRGASLVVTADATNSPQHVTLNATGTGAALQPSSVDFGSKNVGSTSAPHTFTLTNGASQQLHISSITVSGDFAKTNASTCSATVPAGVSCTIVITFTPTAAGLRNGTLTVNDDSPGSSQQTASLSGTGVAVTVGWIRIPASLTSTPAIAAFLGSGRVDAFARGRDNAAYQVSSTNGGNNWGNWSRIGGLLSEAPAAVSSGGGRIDLFVRGTDLALYHRFSLNNGLTWSDWQYIRSTLSAAPAATTTAPGKLLVAVRGKDNAIYVNSSNDSGNTWLGWQYIRANTSSAPAIVAVGNRVDIFARGQDLALYQTTSIDGGKTWPFGWQRISGTLNSAPAVASWASGRLDVYVRGTDLALYHRFSTDGGASWSPWERFAASMTSDPAAVATSNGTISVAARGQDGALYVINFTIS